MGFADGFGAEAGGVAADGEALFFETVVVDGAAAEHEVDADASGGLEEGGASGGVAAGVGEVVDEGGVVAGGGPDVFEGGGEFGFEDLDDVGGAAGDAPVDDDAALVVGEHPLLEAAFEFVADGFDVRGDDDETVGWEVVGAAGAFLGFEEDGSGDGDRHGEEDGEVAVHGLAARGWSGGPVRCGRRGGGGIQTGFPGGSGFGGGRGEVGDKVVQVARPLGWSS